MFKGSCCCGAVKFLVSSPPTMMGTCHCSRCRKVGASTFVFVNRSSFELISGADSITTFKPEAPYKYNRCFCSHCGTALGEVTSTAESFPVAANCIDEALTITNLFHEFVKEKPSWYDICDSAKQFPEHPHR
ncbi:GFA family protein [Pseudomonas sp. B21-048]|uniref:GFA family protein n=1 Tax=Pseudomonas sp. B21-048 TaxID=2895490 RepID=UPI00215E637D|nr:GFA family protein [Pseudomonas sp. B21-048]UVK97008.1 GFA family protein [Pseudomonas sp. B21-048]